MQPAKQTTVLDLVNIEKFFSRSRQRRVASPRSRPKPLQDVLEDL